MITTAIVKIIGSQGQQLTVCHECGYELLGLARDEYAVDQCFLLAGWQGDDGPPYVVSLPKQQHVTPVSVLGFPIWPC